ncbi:MAG: hypothetical protein ACI857_001795, partial [Arenicella sp.]
RRHSSFIKVSKPLIQQQIKSNTNEEDIIINDSAGNIYHIRSAQRR